MKKSILLIMGFICCLFAFSQQVSKVNFDAIKKSLETNPGLYKDLLSKLKKSDTTLSKEDYHTLYYGQCFQDNYNPYGSDYKNLDDFKKHYQAQNYEKALPFALDMLKNNPLDLQMIFKTLVCHHYVNDMESKAKVGHQFRNLLWVIFDSGDGRSAETAIVVMRVGDEYELMANMEVQNTSQALIGSCDVMTLKENDLGIDKLYFNVSKPLGAMAKMLGN